MTPLEAVRCPPHGAGRGHTNQSRKEVKSRKVYHSSLPLEVGQSFRESMFASNKTHSSGNLIGWSQQVYYTFSWALSSYSVWFLYCNTPDTCALPVLSGCTGKPPSPCWGRRTCLSTFHHLKPKTECSETVCYCRNSCQGVSSLY